jgi:hypothetical protein
LKPLGTIKDNINHVHMTNEANFQFRGYVNSHNCRYWTIEKPLDINQEHRHSEMYCLMWCILFWVDRSLYL